MKVKYVAEVLLLYRLTNKVAIKCVFWSYTVSGCTKGYMCKLIASASSKIHDAVCVDSQVIEIAEQKWQLGVILLWKMSHFAHRRLLTNASCYTSSSISFKIKIKMICFGTDYVDLDWYTWSYFLNLQLLIMVLVSKIRYGSDCSLSQPWQIKEALCSVFTEQLLL